MAVTSSAPASPPLSIHSPPSKAALRPSLSSDSSDSIPSDRDALRLAELGYHQDLTRKFTIWSILGTAFALTNSWAGLSASMVTGISSGGTALIIYGVPLIALVSLCVGISLSELASAMPSAGGQYFWAGELAPPRWKRFAGYLTGWFSWAGSIFTSASVALSLALGAVGCYQLSHPDYEPNTYHIFLTYQLTNLVAFVFNTRGAFLPPLAKFTLYFSLLAFVVLIVTIPALTPSHQPAKFVFATFINNTGYQSNALAFIVGLINANWPFACLDCATHLAEEVPRPDRNIPIAILGTVAIGFTTAWAFAIAMFFSLVGDIDTLVHSETGVPILALFNAALTGRIGQAAGAVVLEVLILITIIGCLVASHTWQSRLLWSFARDGGVPFSAWLSQVNRKADVPLRAHIVSCILVALVGCLYLGSYTAFNSMVTACIVLLYVSYAIPVGCLVFVHGRENLKRGTFWLGKWGAVANWVLLAWTLFTLVMYSFPYTMPVTADSMNYVSAVYGVVVLIVAADWYLRGRKGYRSERVSRRNETVIEQVLGEAVTADPRKASSARYGTV